MLWRRSRSWQRASRSAGGRTCVALHIAPRSAGKLHGFPAGIAFNRRLEARGTACQPSIRTRVQSIHGPLSCECFMICRSPSVIFASLLCNSPVSAQCTIAPLLAVFISQHLFSSHHPHLNQALSLSLSLSRLAHSCSHYPTSSFAWFQPPTGCKRLSPSHLGIPFAIHLVWHRLPFII